MTLWIRLRQSLTQRDVTQQVIAGAERFGVHARYSVFDDRWSLSILATSGARLAGPFKLVPGIDLLRPYTHIAGMPQGELFVQGRARVPPTRDTLDEDVRVLYREPTA